MWHYRTPKRLNTPLLLIHPRRPDVIRAVVDQLIDQVTIRVVRIPRRELWCAADEREAADLFRRRRASAPHYAAGPRVHEPHRQVDGDGRSQHWRQTRRQPAVRLHVGDLEMAEEGDGTAVCVGPRREDAARIRRLELAHLDAALRGEHVFLEAMRRELVD